MIKINKNLVFSNNKRPLIIAEISGNHDGKKEKFLRLVKQAFLNGADLVKIQTYEPSDITINKRSHHFKIKNGIWKNKYLWDLYKKACTPYSWHKDAFKIARKFNKTLFSSPFSIRAVDLLESFNVKIYKIASFELTDHKLVKYIASKKKPIIISTGMANYRDIDKAINIIKKYHNKIIILHCVSNYPTDLKDTNLNKIKMLKKKYNKFLIGISDHTKDIISSIASIPLNVVAIEKHFKINNKKTSDSEFSINPYKLKKLKNIVIDLEKSLSPKKNDNYVDKKNIKLRRSIFAIKDINKGDKLNKENINTFRPIIGIPADKYFKVIGKKINKYKKKNHPIFFRDLN